MSLVLYMYYVNPFQSKNILGLFPMCVRSLSSKTSLGIKLLKHGAAFPHTALAMWLMCGHRGECDLDGDQTFQILSMWFIIPSLHWKNHDAERASSQGFNSLINTQSTHVAIFVHCDFMLTYHLHDYKHLCRCIYEIWMCWTAFFSLCLLSEKPCIRVSLPNLGESLSVGILGFVL